MRFQQVENFTLPRAALPLIQLLTCEVSLTNGSPLDACLDARRPLKGALYSRVWQHKFARVLGVANSSFLLESLYNGVDRAIT